MKMLGKSQTMLQKALPLAVVLAFLASLSCTLVSPSHACCKAPEEAIQAASVPSERQVHPCCQKSTVVLSAQTLLPGLDDSILTSPTLFRSSIDWLSLTTTQTKLLETQAYLVNHSDRYLQLRRLLN